MFEKEFSKFRDYLFIMYSNCLLFMLQQIRLYGERGKSEI